MAHVQSFSPLAGRNARVLILGSMPGRRSLAAGQYYTHPHNAFWRILGEIVGFDPASPYARRCAALRAAGISLWDVMASCSRSSSLDADIEEASIVANDLATFLSRHHRIGAVLFNGAKAEASFSRYVLPTLSPRLRAIERMRLPSTSPAHAAMPYESKLAAWRAALNRASGRQSLRAEP